MVVHNLDIQGVRASPAEANAPLVVDTNAVLPFAIAAKDLQTIARNSSEIGEGGRRLDVVQLPLCTRSNTLKFPAELAAEHLLGLAVPE